MEEADGEGLFSTIESAFDEDGIPKDRLFSFASDGASVMTSPAVGVAVRLRNAFQIFLLIAHCVAHRHALACAAAAENNAAAEYFEPSGALSAPRACARAWARARALAALMEYSLAQIEEALHADGGALLRAFSAAELVALVGALFEESDERAALIVLVEGAR